MNDGAIVHAMPAAPFLGAQRRHFMLSVALPTLAALLLPAVVPGLLRHTGWALGLWLSMWFVVGGVGVSVGLHRHFSHRSFDAKPALRALLGVCGAMAAQGPVVYWVSLHRMHHAASDQPGDPHSPRTSAWPGRSRWRAALQGHVGWVLAHDVPRPTRYARELIADPLVRKLTAAYPLCVAAGLLLPALVAWAALGSTMPAWQALAFGAYWGGLVRIAIGHQVIWAINSWCHLHGSRPHATREGSTNVAALSLLSWGESWHNNHHAKPADAQFGCGWRQPDIGWWVVQGFVRMGWATLRRPG